MRLLPLTILFFLIACHSQDRTKRSVYKKSPDTLSNGLEILNTNDSPFYYKDQVGTVSLQGNCQVYYAQDDSSYFLYLKKGDSLSLLNKTTKYTSLHALGRLTGDDTTFFILGHDNGNGAPYTFEFIDKKTGRNPLEYGINFLDLNNLNAAVYLLYADTTINNLSRLILYNTNNKKKEFYELQNDFWELYIDTLTTRELKLKYTIDRRGDTTRMKTYSR